MFELKLSQLGIELPQAPKPLAAYIPAIRTGKYVYTSGQIPMKSGTLAFEGKVGGELTEKQGYEAARLCAINCLSVVKSVVSSLDEIARVVKVTGFVNSASGFHSQPAVVNGASDLLREIFGEAGEHVRSAVGVSELPLNAAVEVEIVVELA